MSELNLEVGKSYEDKQGNVVKIVNINKDLCHPFAGDNGRTYTSYGWFCIHEPGELDLISEVKGEAVSELNLEVGKSYFNIDGGVVEIVFKDGSDDFPFKGDDGDWYSECGDCWMPECSGLVKEAVIGKEEPVSTNSYIDETLAARGKEYGDYGIKSTFIQKIKKLLRDSDGWEDLDDDMKESLDMNATKMGRIMFGNPENKDSWHDIEGYSKLISRRL